MAQLFSIHPQNPQQRLIRQAVEIVNNGGVIVYPTDTSYALGCRIGDKGAMERMRAIRGVDEHHHFTLVCRDLSSISHYAQVDNKQYRLLKSATPGGYTFILKATREVPKRLQHPKRNTIGIRIPDNAVVMSLLDALGEPILSSSLLLPGEDIPQNDPELIRQALQNQVELVIDSGACGVDVTTVIDLTEDPPFVLRRGSGPLSPLGLAE